MHECPEESEITSKYVQLLLEHVQLKQSMIYIDIYCFYCKQF